MRNDQLATLFQNRGTTMMGVDASSPRLFRFQEAKYVGSAAWQPNDWVLCDDPQSPRNTVRLRTDHAGEAISRQREEST